MSDNSKIEWTDASWNPIRAENLASHGMGHFCIHASPGCENCYAERMQPRFQNHIKFGAQHQDKVSIFLGERALNAPLRWRKPRKIFVCSMTDLFGDWVPDAWLDEIFAVMANCRHHQFQVLTKRSARMREYMASLDAAVIRAFTPPHISPGMDESHHLFFAGLDRIEATSWPLPNVWLGVSVEDQRRANERIPDLLATPASIRWLSCEPLLGPVDLLNGLEVIDWVVVGGESGPKARPIKPDWVREIRDQCSRADVPFFFKQWGGLRPKSDGRLLDGILHDGEPMLAQMEAL